MVADFGSGSGHYTLAASELVGESGKVYAIDIQQALLKKVKDLSRTEHRTNIEVLWGDLEKQGGSKLRENSMDVVIVANILFQIEDKKVFCEEVLRVLKPKRRVLVVDWADSFGGLGPQPGFIISENKAHILFENNGFSFDRSIEAGEHHYGLIFRKA